MGIKPWAEYFMDLAKRRWLQLILRLNAKNRKISNFKWSKAKIYSAY